MCLTVTRTGSNTYESAPQGHHHLADPLARARGRATPSRSRSASGRAPPSAAAATRRSTSSTTPASPRPIRSSTTRSSSRRSPRPPALRRRAQRQARAVQATEKRRERGVHVTPASSGTSRSIVPEEPLAPQHVRDRARSSSARRSRPGTTSATGTPRPCAASPSPTTRCAASPPSSRRARRRATRSSRRSSTSSPTTSAT